MDDKETELETIAKMRLSHFYDWCMPNKMFWRIKLLINSKLSKTQNPVLELNCCNLLIRSIGNNCVWQYRTQSKQISTAKSWSYKTVNEWMCSCLFNISWSNLDFIGYVLLLSHDAVATFQRKCYNCEGLFTLLHWCHMVDWFLLHFYWGNVVTFI